MAHENPHHSPLNGPFDSNWTVRELLAAFAEHDSPGEALAPELRRIEQALGDRLGAERWYGTPSAVALLRSIASLCARHPRALGLRLHRLEGADRGKVLQHSHNGRAILVAAA